MQFRQKSNKKLFAITFFYEIYLLLAKSRLGNSSGSTEGSNNTGNNITSEKKSSHANSRKKIIHFRHTLFGEARESVKLVFDARKKRRDL